MTSTIVKSDQELKDKINKRKMILSDEAQKQLDLIEQRAVDARDKREARDEKFDGMSYTQDYYFNRKTANSYLKPKKNDAEVRVVAPTTEKALESWMNEMLSLNLEPETRVFDDNDTEIVELGEDLDASASRTEEIEHDNDMWQDFLFELGTQRAVYIREHFVDKTVKDSRTGKDRRIQRFEKKIVSGLKVFLGDPTLPAYKFHEQPYIVEYDRINYREAKATYEHLYDNFKHVNPGKTGKKEFDSAFDFRMGLIKEDEVEILIYKSFPDGEKQIVINDIPMLEPGAKLDYTYEGYDMRMFTMKSIATDCSYGKHLVASAKVLQAYGDETLRLIIRKFQQALEPPSGVKVMMDERGNPITGRVYSKDIWNPGAMTQGVGSDTFEKLIDHNGVTNSDMEVYNMIDGMVEQFIGRGKLQQGLEPVKNITATQSIEMQRQAIKMLGLSVFAYMRAKRDMRIMRIYTILEKSLEPISKRKNGDKIENVYRQFTVFDTALEQGKIGKKIITFVDKNLGQSELEQLKEKEDELDARGERTRFRFINRQLLQQMPLNFYTVVNQKQQDGSSLDKIMFNDRLAQAANIAKLTGKQISGDEVVEDYERTWGVKDWFQEPELPNQMDPALMQGAIGGQLEGDVKPQEPSINTLASNGN